MAQLRLNSYHEYDCVFDAYQNSLPIFFWQEFHRWVFLRKTGREGTNFLVMNIWKELLQAKHNNIHKISVNPALEK